MSYISAVPRTEQFNKIRNAIRDLKVKHRYYNIKVKEFLGKDENKTMDYTDRIIEVEIKIKKLKDELEDMKPKRSYPKPRFKKPENSTFKVKKGIHYEVKEYEIDDRYNS